MPLHEKLAVNQKAAIGFTIRGLCLISRRKTAIITRNELIVEGRKIVQHKRLRLGKIRRFSLFYVFGSVEQSLRNFPFSKYMTHLVERKYE